MQRVIVDEILHAFASDGNLHLIFGISTGLVNDRGDVKEPQVTLVVPFSSAARLCEDLNTAVQHFSLPPRQDENIGTDNEKDDREFLGPAISIKQP